MVVASRSLDLKQLRHAAQSTPSLHPYVERFELIRRRMEEHCADVVEWAVAYGSFVELVGSGQTKRSRRREKLLIVTKLASLHEAVERLANDVFADVLLTHGHLVDYRVWTMPEFRAASKDPNEVLREVRSAGVTIFGSPPDDSGNADRGL